MDQDDRLIKLLSLLASDMQTIQNSMQAIQKDMRSLHAYTESTDAEVRKLRSDFNASVGNIRELTGRLEIVENQIAENTEALRKSGLDTESLKTDIGEIIASTDQSRDTLDGSSRDIRAAADHIVKVLDETYLRLQFFLVVVYTEVDNHEVVEDDVPYAPPDNIKNILLELFPVVPVLRIVDVEFPLEPCEYLFFNLLRDEVGICPLERCTDVVAPRRG